MFPSRAVNTISEALDAKRKKKLTQPAYDVPPGEPTIPNQSAEDFQPQQADVTSSEPANNVQQDDEVVQPANEPAEQQVVVDAAPQPAETDVPQPPEDPQQDDDDAENQDFEGAQMPPQPSGEALPHLFENDLPQSKDDSDPQPGDNNY